MAEPLTYQLLQRFQSALAGIVADGGTTYFNTPTQVLIVNDWFDTRLWNESIVGPIYAVRRTDRSVERRNTGDAVNGSRDKATVTVVVLVSQRFAPSSPEDTPDLALTVERMLRDVLRKMAFEGPGLGLTIEADDVLAADDAVVEDAPPTWAAGQITFKAVYDYFSSAP